MGKRVLAIALIDLFAVSLAMPGYCDTPVKKLGRGLCNVATCPFELFIQPSKVSNSDGPMAGLTYGILKGVGMTILRGAVGAYETATFLIPLPSGYKPIMTEPEFVFEDMSW